VQYVMEKKKLARQSSMVTEREIESSMRLTESQFGADSPGQSIKLQSSMTSTPDPKNKQQKL
jgi:hypothetical protein